MADGMCDGLARYLQGDRAACAGRNPCHRELSSLVVALRCDQYTVAAHAHLPKVSVWGTRQCRRIPGLALHKEPCMKRCIVAALAMACTIGTAHSFGHKAPAALWLPDLVSTANSEVRITFSPDGKRMLWGAIGWSGGQGGWDIFESRRGSNGWSK